jgi:hypothetical protein
MNAERNYVEQKCQCVVNGRRWYLYDFEFETAGGRFSSYIYALSDEHARMVLAEMKATATLGGRIAGSTPA